MKRIVILLLIITGLYIVFNQSFQFNGFAFAGSKDDHAEISEKVNTIVINVGGVNTTVIPEDRDDVRAVLTGKGKLIVQQDGDEVEVRTVNRWSNWFSFGGKKHLKIYIPKDFNQNVDINIGSGSLNFSGKSMKLDQLSLDIGSGNVNLRDLEVNEFIHDGSSGNVDIDTLTTTTGKFDLSSGNIIINHYKGQLEADVSSGRFNIQMDQLTDSIDIDLSSGNVNLDLPDNADFDLNGEVSSGNISNEFPLTSEGSDKNSIKGIHGKGKHPIHIEVSSGNVRIH